jgi:hypothetical protein
MIFSNYFEKSSSRVEKKRRIVNVDILRTIVLKICYSGFCNFSAPCFHGAPMGKHVLKALIFAPISSLALLDLIMVEQSRGD